MLSQDLSLAGKRKGFEGERSVLFLDQIRIIKEMRERDARNGISSAELRRPRFMVWENVPGAFSSRNGEDFKAVLEETIKVAEPEIPPLSVPEKGWPNAGLIYDEMGGWSVAWRVHDARYWGVPQRRRRIALVADFAGLSAGEILFERKGLCRYSSESERKESFAARRNSDSVEAENSRGRYYDSHPNDSRITGPADTANTVSSRYGTGGNNTPIVVSDKVLCDQGGQRMDVKTNETTTLRAQAHHPPIVTSVYDNHPQDSRVTGPTETAPSMTSHDYGVSGGGGPLIVHSYDVRFTSSGTKNARGNCHETDHCRCLDTGGQDPDSNHGGLVITEAYGAQRSMGGVEARKEQSPTLMGSVHGDNLPMAVHSYGADMYNGNLSEEESCTLTASSGASITHSGPSVIRSYGIQGNTIDRKPQNGGNGTGYSDESVGTLNTIDRHAVVYGLDRASFNQGKNAQYNFKVDEEQSATLVSKGPNAVVQPTISTEKGSFFTRMANEETGSLVATDYKDPPRIFEPGELRYIARRITPIECERLQGFPDNWTDIGEWIDSKGKKRQSTDAMRYKALGNSIALPYWKVLARRIAAQYDRDITMGSLFDGIGGFIVAFQHAGATCKFTAEIEDFPRAVVQYHFGGEDAEVEDETH